LEKTVAVLDAALSSSMRRMAVQSMPNRYADLSVVVIGIECGNRTSNTNVIKTQTCLARCE
jgi:hypothetical protein